MNFQINYLTTTSIIMKNNFNIFVLFIIFGSFISCSGGSKQTPDETKLTGKWCSNHEPFCTEYKADGTFVTTEVSSATPTVISDGKWNAKDGNITTEDNKTKEKLTSKINYINGKLYIGDLPVIPKDCAECEYKTVEEYVTEMGLSKQ